MNNSGDAVFGFFLGVIVVGTAWSLAPDTGKVARDEYLRCKRASAAYASAGDSVVVGLKPECKFWLMPPLQEEGK